MDRRELDPNTEFAKSVAVEASSDECFPLLQAIPKLSRHPSLSERLKLVIDGTGIEILAARPIAGRK